MKHLALVQPERMEAWKGSGQGGARGGGEGGDALIASSNVAHSPIAAPGTESREGRLG